MLDHSAFLAQLAEAREHSANGDYSSAVVYYDGVIDQLSRSGAGVAAWVCSSCDVAAPSMQLTLAVAC